MLTRRTWFNVALRAGEEEKGRREIEVAAGIEGLETERIDAAPNDGSRRDGAKRYLNIGIAIA